MRKALNFWFRDWRVRSLDSRVLWREGLASWTHGSGEDPDGEPTPGSGGVDWRPGFRQGEGLGAWSPKPEGEGVQEPDSWVPGEGII